MPKLLKMIIENQNQSTARKNIEGEVTEETETQYIKPLAKLNSSEQATLANERYEYVKENLASRRKTVRKAIDMLLKKTNEQKTSLENILKEKLI